ncbi:hypothetical protein [Bacillus taeanensis]|uniref:Uncharacterized protein n=1 Tax=Bacillus taeanensis TaxID=273032 RepID=A0A366XRL1_9BACI|nr:hypothetical protein [Bacillus taeanensis]RBW68990.1 hypothetical protein DS031_13715 [Bacillus taeanensis]
MAKKNKKKVIQSDVNKHQYNMKVVHSGICEACKTKCVRGISYIEKMSQPGAVGYGIPCILTKGKAYK